MSIEVVMPVSPLVQDRPRIVREAQQRLLVALDGIAGSIDGNLGSCIRGLSAAVAELTAAEHAGFWHLDAERQTISLDRGSFGFSAAELDALSTLPGHPGGATAMERAVFREGVVRGGDPAHRMRDGISVGWRAGRRRLGAVGAYGSTRRDGFTEDDVWVLRMAATAAAMVWESRQAGADLKLASHELRAPLGIVRGYVSMIQDGTLGAVGDEVASVLPLVRAKIDEMNRLIDEMLETARLDDGALALDLRPLDLREVVADAGRALEPLLGQGHRLTTSIPPGGPVTVRGDRARLSMVVTNLVHNAIKYSPAGGEVCVLCVAGDATARVSVRDHGVGIGPADMGRLFTRFGRILTPATERIPGTGLGLYLARDLARRHGGDIEVASEPGRGSTFTLRLPLAGPSPGTD
jgi:signal transduction histidine kinase